MEHQIIETGALIPSSSSHWELNLILLELSDIARKEAQIDVLARLLRLEELEADLSFRVFVCHLRGQKRDHVPGESATNRTCDLGLVDWLVVLWTH